MINAYLQLICEGNKNVYAMDTFFYLKLKECGYASVSKWNRGFNIFQKSVVLIPIHKTAHWCLVVSTFQNCFIDYLETIVCELYILLVSCLQTYAIIFVEFLWKFTLVANLTLSLWEAEYIKLVSFHVPNFLFTHRSALNSKLCITYCADHFAAALSNNQIPLLLKNKI